MISDWLTMTAAHDNIGQHDALRVLVVEDVVVNQRLASGLLKKQGHSVTVTSNGKEAVEAIKDAEFDLVLMDVEMPVMDGLSATRAIRRRECKLGGHVPVVALTANADRAECIAAGMDAYIPKPLRADVLRATVHQVMGI